MVATHSVGSSAPHARHAQAIPAPAIPLVKVTIRTPTRGIDVALPADVPVAELLSYLLRHAGEDAADAGERHAGWLLRRPTGEQLDPDRPLAAQRVLDGELLQLVPGQQEWPEPEYDDLVETIASGARRYGRSWGGAATRRCGLALAGAILLAGTLVTPLFQPPWRSPGLVLLAAGTLLLAAGVVVARAVPDARAGAVFAGCGLPYAVLGGYLVAAPDTAGITEFGAPQLLLAMVAAVVFGLAGYLGVAALPRVFAAAITVGLLGGVGAFAGELLASDGAAAVTLTVGIGLLPGYPLLAIRLGRLPVPRLPQRPADLLADQPAPATPDVFDAAARTDELLTGILIGLSVVGVAGGAVLTVHDGLSPQLLLAATGLALLLRARLFPIPRQRLPLLLAGVLVLALLVARYPVTAGGNAELAGALVLVVGSALLVGYAGVAYSRAPASPTLGRIADIADVLAVLALVPLTCYLTGFFSYVQSLLAGIG